MNQDRKKYIFDTSALLTFIENENGFEDVENFLVRAEKNEIGVYISFISLVELFYITLQEKKDPEFEQLSSVIVEHRLPYKSSPD